MSSYQDLIVWKRAKSLAVEVLKAMAESRLFALRDQVMRSAISVPSNIAEGAERNSPKEFRLFIGYARGSLAELNTQLMIAMELREIEDIIAAKFIRECNELSRMLFALSRNINKNAIADVASTPSKAQNY